MTIYPGATVRLKGHFIDRTRNIDVDAANVTLTVLRPSGRRDKYEDNNEITHDSPGHYHVDITVDEPGHWSYRFEAVSEAPSHDQARVVCGVLLLPGAIRGPQRPEK